MQPWIWPCSLLVPKSRSTSPGLQVFRSSFCRALTNHLNLMVRPDMATNVHTTWVCSVRLSIRSYVLHMLLFTITYRKYSVSGAMRTRSIISYRRSSCVHSSCLPGCMGGWGGGGGDQCHNSSSVIFIDMTWLTWHIPPAIWGHTLEHAINTVWHNHRPACVFLSVLPIVSCMSCFQCGTDTSLLLNLFWFVFCVAYGFSLLLFSWKCNSFKFF